MLTNMYIQQIGSREKMEEYFNTTSAQIRETLRDNERDGLTVQKMQQKLVGEIKVTPAEVRRYFKDLPQDSIPYICLLYTSLKEFVSTLPILKMPLCKLLKALETFFALSLLFK